MHQRWNSPVKFDTGILIIFIKRLGEDVSSTHWANGLITADDPESTWQQKLKLNFNFSP